MGHVPIVQSPTTQLAECVYRIDDESIIIVDVMRCDNGSESSIVSLQRADWLYDTKTHRMPCPLLLLFNNHYYCYSFNGVKILLYNIFPVCKNNDNNVRKKLFLLSIKAYTLQNPSSSNNNTNNSLLLLNRIPNTRWLVVLVPNITIHSFSTSYTIFFIIQTRKLTKLLNI
ncbi:hypothetical protein AGLY_007616 [Aphis glycines]|uniref:Uncharacterized protein n=1 Tax=Aphis glycines TaxID=307491 RepID=A0A6G0TMH8_APHGL|nr:hypothetical protein AGLY_007616 [Aphis glycines]